MAPDALFFSLVELDTDGRLVSMTIEHATQQTDVREFSFQQVAT